MNDVWNELRFYESIDALKELAQNSHNFEMSNEVALDIRACLYQAREYFESARAGELTIKPLLLYYGVLNLARALILLKNRGNLRLNQLDRAHGLRFIPYGDNPLEDICCEVKSKGTFQELNNSVAQNEKFTAGPLELHLKNTLSSDIANKKFSLLDIWACIPLLEKMYQRSFSNWCNMFYLNLGAEHRSKFDSDYSADTEVWYLCLDKRLSPKRTNDLIQLLVKVLPDPIVDASFFIGPQITFKGNPSAPSLFPYQCSEVEISNNLDGEPKYFNVVCMNPDTSSLPMSSLSVFYLGLYILGMVVRYRPDTWEQVTRLGFQDRSLAYAIQFMECCEEKFPTGVLNSFLAKPIGLLAI